MLRLLVSSWALKIFWLLKECNWKASRKLGVSISQIVCATWKTDPVGKLGTFFTLEMIFWNLHSGMIQTMFLASLTKVPSTKMQPILMEEVLCVNLVTISSITARWKLSGKKLRSLISLRLINLLSFETVLKSAKQYAIQRFIAKLLHTFIVARIVTTRCVESKKQPNGSRRTTITVTQDSKDSAAKDYY